jgi:site-specific recombinase XerD
MRLYKRENGYWYIEVNRGFKFTTGTRDKRIAEEFFRRYREQLSEGKLVKLGRTKHIKVLDMIGEYLEHKTDEGLAGSTLKSYHQSLTQMATILGNGMVRSITGEHVTILKQRLLERGVLKSTINSRLTIVSSFFTWGVGRKYMRDNPCQRGPGEGTLRFRTDKSLPRYLREDEIERLLDGSRAIPGLLLAVCIGLYAGLRASEMLNLDARKDIDLRNRRIIVRRTKSKEDRMVPINAALMKVIGKQLTPFDRYVTGRQWSYNMLRTRLKALDSMTGDHVTFHMLRHTFASYLAMQDISMAKLQRLMGHKDIKTTMIYARVSDESLRESVESLDFGTGG